MGAARTLFLSVVLVASSCTGEADPVRRSMPSPAPRGDGWVTFRHPQQPWTWRHPPGWRVQTFDEEVGLATHEGALLSNVRHRFRYPELGPGRATSSWDFRDVPASAVVLEMSQTVRLAGDCAESTETPVRLTDAEIVRGAYRSPSRRWLSLCIEGQNPFGLHVWLGEEASPRDEAAARKVVRSLRFVTPRETITCEDEEATDLSREPRYTADYLGRWQTSDGCDVRLDVAMMRTGGCYSGETADILLGWPPGSSSEDGASRTYVRDPDDELGDPATSSAFRGEAALPPDARDTLLRQPGSSQLWVVPDDDSFVYVVYLDRVERWPLDPSPPGCG